MKQTFSLLQLTEEACENGKQLYRCSVELKKVYDRVDRRGEWAIMRLRKYYGVDSLGGGEELYKGCEAGMRVDSMENEMFGVNVGLKHGCVMLLWLFNLSMDGVMKEVNPRVMDSGKGIELNGYE